MIIKQSFSTKLSLLTVSASIGVSLVVVLILGGASGRLVFNESRKTITDDLKKCSLEIERKLSNVEAATEGQIWVIKDHLDDPDYFFTLTSRLVEVNDLIMGSSVAFVPGYYPEKGRFFMPYSCIDRETGKITSMQAGNDDYVYEDMEWFKVPMELKRNYWTNPYIDKGAGEMMMVTYSVPLWDEEGTVFAVLTADVSLNNLTRSIGEITLMEGSYPLVVSHDGTYLYHPDTTKIFNHNYQEFFSFSENKIKTYPALEGQTDITESKFHGADGKTYFMAYGPLDNGWYAGIICPYVKAFSETESLVILFLILTTMGLIFMLYSNKRVIELTTQPLTEFSYAAMNMAQGNFHSTIPPVTSHDEIGCLHDSLIYLQKSIINYIDELKTTTADNEKYESELNIAKEIQEQMLTKNFPNNEKVISYAHLHPAKEVGGDLYDIMLKDNNVYFAVGDVSGKGVPAALYMAITRSDLRFMFQMNFSIAQIVYNINNAFCDGNESGMFVTMFVGKVNLDTLEMEYCNAGHNPIIIRKMDGTAEYLHAKPNLAAGLFPDFNYEGERLTLEKGSSILVYSDGVTEAETFGKDQYGEERLLKLFAGTNATGKDMIVALKNDIKEFTRAYEQNDDITALTIHFN